MSAIDTEVSVLLQTLLGQAETCLTVAGRELPEHVFVSHNDPAWDCCNSLTVHLDRGKATTSFPRPSSYRPLQGGVRWALDVVVTLLRCVPTFDGNSLPAIADLAQSGKDLADDAWAIYHGFGCRAVDGSLLANCECDLVSLSPLRPIGPQGGCGGYNFTVSVEPPGAA